MTGFLPLGHMKQLVYETVVKTEELIATITVAAWHHCGHARNLRTDTTIYGPTMYCVYRPKGLWSRI